MQQERSQYHSLITVYSVVYLKDPVKRYLLHHSFNVELELTLSPSAFFSCRGTSGQEFIPVCVVKKRLE